MSVDNELYNEKRDIWWNENEALYFLYSGMNPARVAYFRHILSDVMHIDPKGKRTLDVGCGGGILAEEFARMGCELTGVDPSAPSIATARAHAAQSRLTIDYRVAGGEHLPFEDNSFDIVYCCDVLEHISDLKQVIAETARVLKPGGVYFYDTINRTRLSRLIFIQLAQEWSFTRFVPPHLHDWNMFITPQELTALLNAGGLESRDMAGMSPAVNPLQMVALMRRVNRKRMNFAEFGTRAGFHRSKDLSVSYMGYAVKPMAH